MLFSRSISKDEKAETAITHMIFFIAAVILAMGVVSVLSTNIQSISGASATSSKVMSDQLRTDITIINDPNVVPYASNEYTFYVKNTGRSELTAYYMNVVLDGVLIQSSDLTTDVLDGDVMWRPGDVLVMNVTTSSPLSVGDHSVRVVTENGKADSMNFIIP